MSRQTYGRIETRRRTTVFGTKRTRQSNEAVAGRCRVARGAVGRRRVFSFAGRRTLRRGAGPDDSAPNPDEVGPPPLCVAPVGRAAPMVDQDRGAVGGGRSAPPTAGGRLGQRRTSAATACLLCSSAPKCGLLHHRVGEDQRPAAQEGYGMVTRTNRRRFAGRGSIAAGSGRRSRTNRFRDRSGLVPPRPATRAGCWTPNASRTAG